MGLCLGPDDALIEQPGVQLVVTLEPQTRCKQPLPDDADLILDLPLLPASRRRTGNGLDQMMRAHLREPAVIGALLADEDRIHRRLHVVVDAARAGALEEGERPLVGVKDP